MKMINEMTKKELLEEIGCSDDGLYEEYDEKRLFADGYSLEQLKEIAIKWATDGNETE